MHRKVLGLLIACMLGPICLCGQEIIATLGYPVPEELMVKLLATRGADRYVIDSVRIDAEGRAAFKGPWPGSGFYQLMLPDSDRVDFIIDVREPRIVLAFSGAPLQEHTHVVVSDENKRLWEYKLLSREAQAIQTSIRQERAALDATAVARAAELDSLERRTQRVQSSHLTRLINDAPDGYFAKAVRAGRVVENADNPQRILEKFDLTDTDLLRSTVYPKALMSVIQLQPVYSEDQFEATADTLLRRTAPNKECYAYTLGFLLDLFDQLGPEMVFQSLAQRYVLDVQEAPALPERVGARVKALSTVAIGAVMPDVKLPVAKEDSVGLASIAARSKFLTLMFYTSTCDHCHEQMPGVAEVLKAYGSRGLAVIGIALDPDNAEFDKCIREHGVTWPCYNEQQAWGSPTAKAFQVKATPSFVVLDSAMRIVAKPKDAAMLAAFAAERL